MRSPGNRPLGEHLLRGIALACLTTLTVRLASGSRNGGVGVASTAALDSALAAWTLAPPARASLAAQSVPDRTQRDWLVGLRRLGTPVEWGVVDSSGTAMVVERAAGPGHADRVTVLSDSGRAAVLADRLGVLDSVRAGNARAAWWSGNAVGPARLVDRAGPVAMARDSLVLRPALVAGSAGWESRFVVAALEEAGWTVLARLAVAPGISVSQGGAVPFDTASLSAVVVLDSAVSIDRAALVAFVRQGGGLVAAGAGASHPALRTVMPGPVSGRMPGRPGGLLEADGHAGLAARTFTVSEASVVLARRHDAIVSAARRVGAGRVAVVGFEDTWRLRMVPVDDRAPAEHRAWWSSLVGSVAYAKPVSRSVPPLDEAPRAAAVAALGMPRAYQGSGAGMAFPIDAVLFALALAAFLGEWLSRRLRGER